MLHVVPDERGRWRVYDPSRQAPLSEHDSATDAERTAWSHLSALGGQEIVLHDRYGRTRRLVDRRGRGRRRDRP